MHSYPHIITAPQLGVNETAARLTHQAREGEWVRPGTALCHLETVKAAFEIEADAEGFLLYCVEDGLETVVNEPLLMLCDTREQFEAERARLQEQRDARSIAKSVVAATQRAHRRAEELGVDLNEVRPAHGIIQAADVEQFAAARRPSVVRAPITTLTWPSSLQPTVIFGAGRGGQTVLECLRSMGGWHVVAFVDDQPAGDSTRHGVPLYPSSLLGELREAGVSTLALGVAGASNRLRILSEARAMGFQPMRLVHPTAFIAPGCRLGDAVTVKAGAILETDTVVGDACIIDNGVIVAHHNMIGAGVHLAPGASLGSGIEIGPRCIVGVGASIATGCKLGQGCIVAPGSSVVANFDARSVIEGVPGRCIGQAKET